MERVLLYVPARVHLDTALMLRRYALIMKTLQRKIRRTFLAAFGIMFYCAKVNVNWNSAMYKMYLLNSF